MTNDSNGWGRRWQILQPALSWGLGSGLLIWATVGGHGRQAPEWYVIVGGMLGFPLVTQWGKNMRNGK